MKFTATKRVVLFLIAMTIARIPFGWSKGPAAGVVALVFLTPFTLIWDLRAAPEPRR